MAEIRRRVLNPSGDIPPMPTFTRAQVEALRARFPVRIMDRNEPFEFYKRYCGMVEVVELIAAHCPDLETPSNPTAADPEKAWDDEAEAIAHSQM